MYACYTQTTAVHRESYSDFIYKLRKRFSFACLKLSKVVVFNTYHLLVNCNNISKTTMFVNHFHPIKCATHGGQIHIA